MGFMVVVGSVVMGRIVAIEAIGAIAIAGTADAIVMRGRSLTSANPMHVARPEEPEARKRLADEEPLAVVRGNGRMCLHDRRNSGSNPSPPLTCGEAGRGCTSSYPRPVAPACAAAA